MSILYLLLIEHSWVGGIFYIGRFVDLLQLDAVILLLWRLLRYQKLRWRRLTSLDKEQKG